MSRIAFLPLLLAGWGALPAPAAADGAAAPFKAGKAGKGEIRFVNGVPVVVCSGTSAEMGEQFGRLAVAPAKPLMDRTDEMVKVIGIERVFPVLKKTAGLLAATYPPAHREEIEAAAQAGGVDRNLLLMAYLASDARKFMGCSTLVVEPGRSQTGKPLFGRNLDWHPIKGLPSYTLVAVFRGKAKHAFASVTVAPITGCFSAMNDAGLCVTHNTITASKDGAPAYDPSAPPMLLLIRRLMEECATVDEAEKFLKTMPRASACALTVCDTRTGAVFEVTPRSAVRRAAESGVCCCTNHFRSDELGVPQKCWRYPILEESRKREQPFGVSDVAGYLDRVSQSDWTFQSMIFEPGSRTLHLRYGEGPLTGKKYAKLQLGELFDSGFVK